MIKDRGYRCIEIGGHALALEWADKKSAILVDLLCQGLPYSDGLIPASVFRLHTNTNDLEFTIFNDNAYLYRGNNQSHGLSLLIDAMIKRWSKLCTKGLLLRGALVSIDGKGAIIIGRPGSGKTSLAASLLLSGWSYHGDQLVFITADGQSCQAFASPFWFRDGWKSSFCEQVLSENVIFKDSEKTLISPADLMPGGALTNHPVVPKLLFVTNFETGSRLSLKPLRAGLAAFHLVEALLNNNNLRKGGLDQVGKIIRGLHSYELVYGGFEQLTSFNRLFSQLDDVE